MTTHSDTGISMTHPVVAHLMHMDVHALRHLLDNAPAWVAKVNGVNTPGGAYLAAVRDELCEELAAYLGDGCALAEAWATREQWFADNDRQHGEGWYLDVVLPGDRAAVFASLELDAWREYASLERGSWRRMTGGETGDAAAMSAVLRDVAMTLCRALVAHAERLDLEAGA